MLPSLPFPDGGLCCSVVVAVAFARARAADEAFHCNAPLDQVFPDITGPQLQAVEARLTLELQQTLADVLGMVSLS